MPLMAPDVTAATGMVVMVNVAVVAPAAIVTLAGTVAAAFAEVIVTTLPAVGAGPLNVKVAVELDPP